MKRSLTSILVGVLIAAVAVLGVALDRSSRHGAFHRSQAFKYKRWAELALIYPLDTSLDTVVADLALPPSAALRTGPGKVLNVTVPLEIATEDYRDYRGFTFVFRNDALIKLEPIGPDGAGLAVPMTVALRRKLEAL